jgi:D-glycero-alpha-D-manno-heptose 1-phosphate guanylyltransferase
MKTSFVAIILIGGRSTRLGNITLETPKCLLEFNGYPFLYLLTRKLVHEGCKSIVLVLGFHAEKVRSYVKEVLENFCDFSSIIEISGTASAIKEGLILAAPEENVLCLNGDTILDVNYGEVFSYHLTSNCDATLVTTDLIAVPNFGAVEIDLLEKVVSFNENKKIEDRLIKVSQNNAFVSNCGCYCLKISTLMPYLTSGDFKSFEKEVLPITTKYLLTRSYANGLKPFIDFGTPEKYNHVLYNFHLYKYIYYL